MIKFITLFILSIFLLTKVNAQINDRDSLGNRLDEIVITGRIHPIQEKNALYNIKVIRKEKIRKLVNPNLAEALQHQLNIDLSHSPIFGTGIELNGISKENIKILIDGIPITGGVNGVLNLQQIDLSRAERIEIIEGPVSVFYGTDAMGGIINIITRKNTTHPQKEGNIYAGYESLGAYNSGISLQLGSWEISGSYYNFNGINTQVENNRNLSWPERKQWHGHIGFSQHWNKIKLNYAADYGYELIHTLGEPENETAKDIDYLTPRLHNTLNLKYTPNKKTDYDLNLAYLYYHRYDQSYLYNTIEHTTQNIDKDPASNDYVLGTWFLKGVMSHKFNKRTHLLSGLEYNGETGHGNRIEADRKQYNSTAVFSSLDITLSKKLHLQPAIRYSINSLYKDIWSPALIIKYNLREHQIFRLSYARGYRSPTLKELYLDWSPTFGPFTYTFKGNTSLLPETSHSISGIFTIYPGNNDRISYKIQPSVHFNSVDNLIGLSNMINFERHYMNLNRMKTLNFSLLSEAGNENWKTTFGFTYLGRYFRYNDTFDSGGYMFSPSISSNISYRIPFLDTSISTRYKYTGRRKGHYIEDGHLITTHRRDYHTLDISISKKILNDRIGLQAGASNIFNVKDIESYNQIGNVHERNIQMRGRFYYIKTTFSIIH